MNGLVWYRPGSVTAVVSPALLVLVDTPVDSDLAVALFNAVMSGSPIDQVLALVTAGGATAPKTWGILQAYGDRTRAIVSGGCTVTAFQEGTLRHEYGPWLDRMFMGPAGIGAGPDLGTPLPLHGGVILASAVGWDPALLPAGSLPGSQAAAAGAAATSPVSAPGPVVHSSPAATSAASAAKSPIAVAREEAVVAQSLPEVHTATEPADSEEDGPSYDYLLASTMRGSVSAAPVGTSSEASPVPEPVATSAASAPEREPVSHASATLVMESTSGVADLPISSDHHLISAFPWDVVSVSGPGRGVPTATATPSLSGPAGPPSGSPVAVAASSGRTVDPVPPPDPATATPYPRRGKRTSTGPCSGRRWDRRTFWGPPWWPSGVGRAISAPCTPGSAVCVARRSRPSNRSRRTGPRWVSCDSHKGERSRSTVARSWGATRTCRPGTSVSSRIW